MKDFFKPADFIGKIPSEFTHRASVEANEKLNALIESWPVVYGAKFISNDGSAFDIGSVWNITKLADKTHKARLAFVEEIAKEPCKHEPLLKILDFSCWQHVVCGNCGVELQATWSEKK